ncbi:MAG: hypothetical protein V4858_14995 [Pseudomonadota bacterium]
MIVKSKEIAALKALQAVLVRARAMASQKEEYRDIANLMDTAEYLVALIYDNRDMTSTFRENLVDLVERHQCGIALTKFDTDC